MKKRHFTYGKHDFTAKRIAQERRFDSIARLLNSKDDVCTAVCFNHGQILLANNSGAITQLQQDYIAFFKNCAVRGKTYTSTPQFQVEYISLLERSIAEESKPGIHIQKTIQIVTGLIAEEPLNPRWEEHLRSLKTRNIGQTEVDTDEAPFITQYLLDKNPKSLQPILENYKKLIERTIAKARERLEIDINKVVHSLTEAADTSFSPAEKEAFKKPFLFIGSSNNKLHAEMKILDYLYLTDQMDNDSPSSIQNTGPVYLGISKLCCLNCSATIKTLKETLHLNITEDLENGPEDETDITQQKAQATKTMVASAHVEQLPTPRQNEKGFNTPRREETVTMTPPNISPIKIRGYHLNSFPNWNRPSFLSHYRQLNEIYEMNLALLDKETKVGHQPGKSPTPIKKQYIHGDIEDSERILQQQPPPFMACQEEGEEDITAFKAAVAHHQPTSAKTTPIPLIDLWQEPRSKPHKISFIVQRAVTKATALDDDDDEVRERSATPNLRKELFATSEPLLQQKYRRQQHFVDTAPQQRLSERHIREELFSATPKAAHLREGLATPGTVPHQQKAKLPFVDTTPKQGHAQLHHEEEIFSTTPKQNQSQRRAAHHEDVPFATSPKTVSRKVKQEEQWLFVPSKLQQRQSRARKEEVPDTSRLVLTNRFAGIAGTPKHVAQSKGKDNFVEREVNRQKPGSESQK